MENNHYRVSRYTILNAETLEINDSFINIAYRDTQYYNMKNQQLKPQDILLLLKIISDGNPNWNQKPMAEALGLSQSEVSESVSRSKYSGFLDPKGKTVMTLALLEFIQYGLRYVFPQRPGPLVRGIPTAHSASPLKEEVQSSEAYVWPYGKGTVRGQSVMPLYASAPEAALKDKKLHEFLALVDAIRVGRARERELAVIELKKRFNFAK